ncbi:hypothetical protein GCM10010129_05240 [Streptomyces fumigatiscleroticus]|nr:hypothetical protein GCM10010129_05240 [Streptomyces fumigatiscleroticus]
MAVSPDMSRLLESFTTDRTAASGLPPGALGACTVLLGLDGLCLSLSRYDGSPELLHHHGERAPQLEDVQFTQGHGPGLEVLRTGGAVTAPDLTAAPPGRWPGLVPELLALGVRAVFAFPLALGPVRLGVLTGHRARPGALTGQQYADAEALARRLTALLLDSTDYPDTASVRMIETAHLHRAEVHQATGMVAVQLGVGTAEALVRIRAHAFRSGRPLFEVAHDILARELVLGSRVPFDGGD